MKYESLPVYRSGVPVACRHYRTLDHSDGDPHGPGFGHYRDGLVRSAGSTRICTRRSRIQHGEVSQPLHAAYLRLRDGELLRQFHSRTWLFPQGLHRRRHDQSCESNWIRWLPTMLNEINAASSKTGPGLLNTMMSPYYAMVYFAVQFLLALLAAIVSAIVAYGAIAATI